MREPKLKGIEKRAYLILKKEKRLTKWILIEDLKINSEKADNVIKSLLKKGKINEKANRK